MGAWGMGSFENDGALGLLADVVHSDDLSVVREVIDGVLANDDYIEVDDAQEAMAAGEVVALLMGRAGEKLPERLITWQQAHPLKADDALREQAAQAVQKVFDASEMRELWEETPNFAEWQAAVQDLLKRLNPVSG